MNNAFQKTLEYLYSKLPMFQRTGASAYKKDLHNTINLAKKCGNPQHSFPTIHIAGTNGKGSTTHLIGAIYQAAGLRVGYYTSPHYRDFRERIKINGVLVSKSFVTRWVNQHREDLETIQPSFFEVTVVMAFEYFAQQKVDIAIIETGLGGRLDSTNILLPKLSVITNIDFDHMDLLGDTLPEIAFEKAGIIKPQTPVVIGEQKEATQHVFTAKATADQAPLFWASETWDVSVTDQSTTHTQFAVQLNEQHAEQRSLSVNLLGEYQIQNVRTALTAWLVANTHTDLPKPTWTDVQNGWKNLKADTHFIGRWQVLSSAPLCITDSGHNEAGIHSVVQQLAKTPYRELHLVLGAASDKDVKKMLALFPANAHFYFAKPNVPRGMDQTKLQTLAAEIGIHGKTYLSVRRALAAAKRRAHPDDLIFVGGSSFVVAEVV